MLNSAEDEIQTTHTEIVKTNGNFRFKSQKPAMYPTDNCPNIYEQDKI